MLFDRPTKEIHRNIPQLLESIIQATITVLIWGRRTGKTEGPISRFTVTNIHAMPRSNGFLLGSTYEQLLTRTIPPLVAAWEKWGYRENVHFWLRKEPEAKLRIPKAFRNPLKYDYYIKWYNGSGIYLVSQDRPGTINGVATQWGAGDEAKFLNKDKLENEVLLTFSGLAAEYGHLSNYLSLMLCSDMPTSPKGKWLLDFKNEGIDEETIGLLVGIQQEITTLHLQLQQATDGKRARLQKRINQLMDYLNEIRKDTTYCSFASTLDNIHALGLDVIKQFKRTLSDLVFQISVLNKRIYMVENGFYGWLDEDIHGYDAFNYAYIDSLEHDFRTEQVKDCRWHSDIQPYEPLSFSADYNNNINSLVVGQRQGNVFRLVKSMYVLGKEGKYLKHLAKQFHEYFKYHHNRYINYYFDHTAVGGDASSDISFADEWCDELEKLGWEVNRCYVGQASTHHSRYYFWQMILAGDDPRLPEFGFNKTECQDWMGSCQGAGVTKSGDFIKKDKSSEKPGSGVDPWLATHLSEAGDCLIWGELRGCIDEVTEFIDNVIA